MEFVIQKINKNYAKYLVFGISAESPLFLLNEIKGQLSLKQGEIVLFDQLLQTGNSDNRFLLLTFDGKDFDLSTIKHIDLSIVEDDVKVLVANFLRNNTALLKYSILLAQQKELLLKGGTL